MFGAGETAYRRQSEIDVIPAGVECTVQHEQRRRREDENEK